LLTQRKYPVGHHEHDALIDEELNRTVILARPYSSTRRVSLGIGPPLNPVSPLDPRPQDRRQLLTGRDGSVVVDLVVGVELHVERLFDQDVSLLSATYRRARSSRCRALRRCRRHARGLRWGARRTAGPCRHADTVHEQQPDQRSACDQQAGDYPRRQHHLIHCAPSTRQPGQTPATAACAVDYRRQRPGEPYVAAAVGTLGILLH
jgi:hypothetical protein